MCAWKCGFCSKPVVAGPSLPRASGRGCETASGWPAEDSRVGDAGGAEATVGPALNPPAGLSRHLILSGRISTPWRP